MESALRPRDIQARIRAGDSPEKVAAAAQTSVEKIMGFATPVLAERAHIAERAQRSSVRRKAGEGASRLLGDILVGQERYTEAESLLVPACSVLDASTTMTAQQKREAYESVIALYEAWGKSAETAVWRTRLAEEENQQ